MGNSRFSHTFESDFTAFFRIIHGEITNCTLYELTAKLFEVVNDELLITDDMVSNWLKGNNHSYRKQLKDGRGFKPFNDDKFIEFIKDRTNQTWKDIQLGFSKYSFEHSVIDYETTDVNVFLKSMVNQFKEIIGYPYKIDSTNQLDIKRVITLGQMKDVFIEIIDHYNSMNIINRNPPVLYRNDSIALNISQQNIEKHIIRPCKQNHGDTILYRDIETFFDSLLFRTLSIEATFNRYFEYEDETASINMDTHQRHTKFKEKEKQKEISQLSIKDVIAASTNKYDEYDECDENDDDEADIEIDIKDVIYGLSVIESLQEEWGNFRKKMNILYDKICKCVIEKTNGVSH